MTTFSPGADDAQDVLTMLEAAGTRDPKPLGARGEHTVRQCGPTAWPVGNHRAEQRIRLYPGAVTTLTSDYEGNDGPPVNHTRTSRATTAQISFNLAVNPASSGVIVQRTSDQNVRYQRADVKVDGVSVGQWLQPLANPTHRWLDDSFQLPPSATAGKSRITITLTPVAGAPVWNAASYRAVSVALVNPMSGS